MKALFIFIMSLFITFTTMGQELRQFTPIRTKVSVARKLPPGGRIVEPVQPLPEGTFGRSAEAIANTWNLEGFHKLLSESFYNKSRLDDAMRTQTAKDARLRILNRHDANIISQVIVPDSDGGHLRISTVSVVLDTRAEFNDPRNGFISVPGTNEMIMEIAEKIE